MGAAPYGWPILPAEQRTRILQDAILYHLGPGGRVVAQTPTTAVLVIGKPVNHVLHLLLTVVLCGLWLPVWVIAMVSGGEKRREVSVDEFGQVRWLG